jgi:hypothetical protein
MILASLWPGRNGHALIEDLGFLRHEPEEEYRAKSRDYLDGEQLSDFREDAFLFHKRQRGLIPPQTQHDEKVDRAALVRILHGQDYYQAQYVIGGPISPHTGQPYSQYSMEYQQWAAQQSKQVLTAEQADLIEHIDFGFRAHDAARQLLSDGVAQGILRRRYCGILCQARIDWLNPKQGIVAVVPCDRLSSVESQVRYLGPAHDFALWQALLAQVTGSWLPVHLIAVEKRLPHRCGVWAVSERLLRRARKDNEKALASLLKCRQLDRWPTGYERVRTLAPIGI